MAKPPSLDPRIPHPGRTFFAGRWRTDEEVERVRGHKRKSEKSSRMRDRRTPVSGRQWYMGRWRTPEEVVSVRERNRARNAARYVPRERKPRSDRLTDEERERRANERRHAKREARRAARRGAERIKAQKALDRRAPAQVRSAWSRAQPNSIMRRKWPTMKDLDASALRGEWDGWTA
jgi:hypothetical protein